MLQAHLVLETDSSFRLIFMLHFWWMAGWLSAAQSSRSSSSEAPSIASAFSPYDITIALMGEEPGRNPGAADHLPEYQLAQTETAA